MERPDVLVVGGGSAGLSVSHELGRQGVEHLVLERGRVGQGWRDRWDSFCLVTPNWSVQLPGGVYTGPDPDGYMPRDEIAAFLAAYAASFGAPIREGVSVHTIAREDGGFTARTSDGDVHAREVVLATGAFQRAHRPAEAATLPGNLLQIDITAYRNPAALPQGPVLVIGSGQSGAQLAEELHEGGRRVVLSCGRAPWVPRRVGGRDIVWWLMESGFFDQPVGALPSPRARLGANPLSTGHGGGHDLDLRTLRALGVELVGRFLGAEGCEARFAPDLAASVAWGDDRYREIMALSVRTAERLGLPPSSVVEPAPFDPAAPERVDLTGFGAVIFTGGFRPDYASWLPWPEAFDDMGFPLQFDGASTVVDGLSFVGTHFLRKRKSSILAGVGEDASVVAAAIAGRLGAA
jgi:putative flavoprotein involved in K+ transport